MIRIVVADDHTIVREGLKQLLSAPADLCVVGEAQDGHQVMQRVRELEFDVLLLDMSMPGKSGIELIKQVRGEKPRLRILILSMHEEQQYAVRAIKAGAAGYLTKESASAQLVSAIRRIAGGGAYIIGPAVNGGLYAEYPSVLRKNWLNDEDLRPTIDFRGIYGTVLEQWMVVDPVPIVGGQYEQVRPYREAAAV